MWKNKQKIKRVALIGFPLKHSLSPAMHNAAFGALNLPYEYILLETRAEKLRDQVQAARGEDFIGFNVTIPHKEAVIPLLDKLDPLAKSIGAVNTVKIEEEKLIGYNTDAAGFLNSLKEDAGFDPTGKRVLIIGAGGAARAVAASLLNAKAGSVSISDVIKEKAKALARHFNEKIKIETPGKKSLKNIDLLINASPTGMHPKVDRSPLEGLEIPKNLLVYDLVYNPYETKLMKDAKKNGAKVCSGLGMLIRQGARAFEIFTGKEAPYEVMKQAACRALGLSV